MKQPKSLLMMIGPKDKGDDDESPPESGEGEKSDDSHETKLDSMRELFAAMKDNDPEAGLAAFSDLCELHEKGGY
jgi:hypothetical protein